MYGISGSLGTRFLGITFAFFIRFLSCTPHDILAAGSFSLPPLSPPVKGFFCQFPELEFSRSDIEDLAKIFVFVVSSRFRMGLCASVAIDLAQDFVNQAKSSFQFALPIRLRMTYRIRADPKQTHRLSQGQVSSPPAKSRQRLF